MIALPMIVTRSLGEQMYCVLTPEVEGRSTNQQHNGNTFDTPKYWPCTLAFLCEQVKHKLTLLARVREVGGTRPPKNLWCSCCEGTALYSVFTCTCIVSGLELVNAVIMLN